MNKTFTYGRMYFRQWMALLVLFCCFSIGSTVLPVVLIRHPLVLVVALPLGAFWSIFAFMSWYYLRRYWTDRIIFRDGEMEITWKGSTAAVAPRCESAEWEFVPDRELRLDLGSDWEITIEFDRYDKELRSELIRACHDAVPHEVQRGWIADFDSPQRRRRHAVLRCVGAVVWFTLTGWLISGFILHDLDVWPWNSFWQYLLVTLLIFLPLLSAYSWLVNVKWAASPRDESGPPEDWTLP